MGVGAYHAAALPLDPGEFRTPRLLFAAAMPTTSLAAVQAWAQPEGGRGLGMVSRVVLLRPAGFGESLRGPAIDMSSPQLHGRRRAGAE